MTPEETAACQAALAEAKSALHQLRLGKAVVSIGYGDRRVQYSSPTIPTLQAYIAELENQCGTGLTDPCAAPTRRPFRIIF